MLKWKRLIYSLVEEKEEGLTLRSAPASLVGNNK